MDGEGGGVGRVDGWTVEQAQTNLPLQFLRSWGHNNAFRWWFVVNTKT